MAAATAAAAAKFPAKVMAEVYRQHHIPLPPITLQALLQRGPRASPDVAKRLQGDAAALARWQEENAPVIVKSAQLLHREVPIRLARRIVDLENLPHGLPDAPAIVKLREELVASFEQMITSPVPQDLAGEREFMAMHRRIREEHATMHNNLADALQTLTHEPHGLSRLLDDFYNSRIGIRMLVDQHVAAQQPVPGFSGIIADHCSPVRIAEHVIAKVEPLWSENLRGRALPEFRIEGQPAATYRYIPQHIELILSEVIKNAVLNSLSSAATTASATAATGAHPRLGRRARRVHQSLGPRRRHDARPGERAVLVRAAIFQVIVGLVLLGQSLRSRVGGARATHEWHGLPQLLWASHRVAVRALLWWCAVGDAHGRLRCRHVHLYELPHRAISAQVIE
ncbi:hypothetical protein PINS_up002220 [Pythium insidiosum]|nr:hypothetical protein PINS_up002220 [Pythium insidiosum]